jgi:hypothetical protein
MSLATTSTTMTAPAPLEIDGHQLIIERLTPEGKYAAVQASGFLPVRAEEIRRWILEDPRSERDWVRWARAELQRKRGGEPR